MSNSFTPPLQHRETYSALDGLRAYAAVGIVMMHVLANITTKPSDNVLTKIIIPWFTDFTLLFMVISAFSMCCGYYERIKTGAITPATFYSKRYQRIWPFFAIMVVLAFAMDPSLNTFYQSFADLTLCFNLLRNPEIEVIGVGWFLGVVFTFYMLFPFFTFLLDNKKRAWKTLGLSLVFAFTAIQTFNGEKLGFNRSNIINVAPFFVAGGIVYLYRSVLKTFVEKWRYAVALGCITLNVAIFFVPNGELYVLTELGVFTLWLIYGIGSKDIILNNRIVKYLSGISMEIYLCHMMFFRVVEKVHLERFIHQNDVLYALSFILTLIGTVVFSHVVKYLMLPRVLPKQ